MAVKKEVVKAEAVKAEPIIKEPVEKKTRAKKVVKELVVEKRVATPKVATPKVEEPEEIVEEPEEKGVVYKPCPVCKEIKVKFFKEGGWFWAACKSCDSRTYMFKNEYMLNDAYDKGRFNKPKV